MASGVSQLTLRRSSESEAQRPLGETVTLGHVVGDDGAQRAPAALVGDDDVLTMNDLACGCIPPD